MRWREWILCVEAVIFAAAEPVSREVLVRVVGKTCNLDFLVDDIARICATGPTNWYGEEADEEDFFEAGIPDDVSKSEAS